MSIVAVLFTVVGMSAALGRHIRSPLRTIGALGMGAIMLGVLVLPSFSHVAAAALTVVLLLVVLGGGTGIRLATRQPLAFGQRTAVAVTIVDIGFMAAAVLLMPAHAAVRRLAPTPPPGGIHGFGTHPALAGGLTTWLVLLVWASCAAVLIVPALLRRSPGGALHVLCSGSMIAAMAAMAS